MSAYSPVVTERVDQDRLRWPRLGEREVPRVIWWSGVDQASDSPIRQQPQLLTSSQEAGPGQRNWVIPPGYRDFSGKAPLVYAHGAAGVRRRLLHLPGCASAGAL
jgi:hypothetical protein